MNSWAQPLEGMTALIVGGGGDGIGRAISRAFASAGAAVAVADIDRGRARDAVEDLTGSGAQALALAGDVRSRSAADDFVAATVAQFGRLDTLVTVVGADPS